MELQTQADQCNRTGTAHHDVCEGHMTAPQPGDLGVGRGVARHQPRIRAEKELDEAGVGIGRGS